jgi:hypothetical protein
MHRAIGSGNGVFQLNKFILLRKIAFQGIKGKAFVSTRKPVAMVALDSLTRWLSAPAEFEHLEFKVWALSVPLKVDLGWGENWMAAHP